MIMIIVPASILPAPKPAITRPPIRAPDEGDNPQTREPSSKIRTPNKKTHLVGYSVYSLPHIICTAASENRYELPYQPTSPRDWNSSVIRGMAVARIVSSWEGGFSIGVFAPGSLQEKLTNDTQNSVQYRPLVMSSDCFSGGYCCASFSALTEDCSASRSIPSEGSATQEPDWPDEQSSLVSDSTPILRTQGRVASRHTGELRRLRESICDDTCHEVSTRNKNKMYPNYEDLRYVRGKRLHYWAQYRTRFSCSSLRLFPLLGYQSNDAFERQLYP